MMSVVHNDLDAFWMPFTANRQFKSNPRLLVSAEGMHYQAADGRRILDGVAGLWCVNAGHGRRRIVDAVQREMTRLDYAPSFQIGHPRAFEAATRLSLVLPQDLDRIFFTNSGSEAVDTALKIAIAYHRACGNAGRTRVIGREQGYHGVGLGGTAIGGIGNNRKAFSALFPAGVDHLPHTHFPQKNAFSRGQPEYGVEAADELERLVALHDPSTIAAVVVEPVAASGGVLIPPKSYLERLREVCTRHGLLLVLDEVITGFGRLGATFAAEKFGIKADLITMAKGLTNGTVPMGAVAVQRHIYDALMDAAAPGTIEFFHGYTYSGHPLAAAAAIAALDVYTEERLFDRAAATAPYFADVAHSLKDARHVIDIRTLGLVAGVELEPRPNAPGRRAYETLVKCFDKGLLVRATADTIAFSPPLIVENAHVDTMFSTLRDVLKEIE